MSGDTYVEAVANYFKAWPNRWLDGMELAQFGGAYAWRSRVSDCRKLGMDIINRQRKVGRRTVSEYCFRPPSAPVQMGIEL